MSRSKRTSSQCSLLSLGVKRIGCCSNEGENSSEGQPESEPPDDADDPDLYDTDSTDEPMVCSNNCCRPDRDGPKKYVLVHCISTTESVKGSSL